MYIPYKKISKNQKGKGGYGKKLKFPISSSSTMPRHKKTPTQKELIKAVRAKKLASGSGGGKPRKSATFSKNAHVPRASQAPRKGGGGGRAPPTG